MINSGRLLPCASVIVASFFQLVTFGQWNLQWSEAEYSGFINYFDERPIVLLCPDGGVVVKTGRIGFTTGRDIQVLKYDDSGSLLWSYVWNGPVNGNDRAYNMALDNDGNIYVAGSAQVGLNDDDALVLKLGSNGDLIWSQTLTGIVPGSDRAATLVVDDTGHVYVGGWLATTGTSSGRVMLAKISAAGSVVWQVPLGSDEHWLRVMVAAMRIIDGNCRFLYGYWGNSGNRYRNLLYRHRDRSSLMEMEDARKVLDQMPMPSMRPGMDTSVVLGNVCIPCTNVPPTGNFNGPSLNRLTFRHSP
ncbi:MAG: SBBP repeat-containing protein [Flavobacteriales bacterium]